MGTSWIVLKAALIQLGLLLCARAGPTLMSPSANIVTITRQNNGDIFHPDDVECIPDTCVGVSSGTAGPVASSNEGTAAGGKISNINPTCVCQCHPHLPAFREDLQICVDDIHECVLAPFVSGSTSQQIPFVFLPLKGQIIHPSKEISFAGIQKPVCAVSGAKFLTEGGWIDLRNPLDADVPFRLFRDEGRTFLQWVGETELRNRMGGRLVLVHLMCREISTTKERPINDPHTVFTPCVAFRVVGTPAKYLSNVSEVLFSANDSDGHNTAANTSTGLSLSEYVAIGVSSVLLGLIYVASVFLYLHLRRRRRDSEPKDRRLDGTSAGGGSREGRDGASAAGTYGQSVGGNCGGIGNRDGLQDLAEEGGVVVKSNPLLSLRHFSSTDTGGASFSDTTSSDTDNTPDIIQHHDDRKKNIQITSALIHPQYNSPLTSYQHISLESSSIERLPEENVSIVETLECREDRPDTVKSISGTIRRKLYFNPAYFDPQLLASPPPAAMEFLTKIREVIAIAKQKMATKRFTPILLCIPEEDSHHIATDMSEYSVGRALSSRRDSMISLKRENSRRRTCSGCPGCEPQDFKALSGKLPQFPALGACHNCANTTSNDSKQRSIRKWLEDVPIIKTPPTSSSDESKENVIRALQTTVTPLKRIRSPARSLSPILSRTRSPRPSSEHGRKSTTNNIYEHRASSVKSQGSSTKSSKSRKRRSDLLKHRAPPPPLPPNPPRVVASNIKRLHRQPDDISLYDSIAVPQARVPRSLPPPDMIHEAMQIEDPHIEDPHIPTITKRNMNAVLNEFAVQHGLEQTKPNHHPRTVDYETDSLERSKEVSGYCTPTEYADVSSSQPSPSLSSALPMDEELTMHNAIINTKTGNMTISKINLNDVLAADEDDYELIILKKSENGQHCIYKLPELLQRNHGYSLVSEVYVNNGYNYGSAPSTPNDSNCSTLERMPKIIYEDNKPGHLLIEVEDCPDNYIRVDDSDNFEPDTLDRKPSKMKLYKALNDAFEDSLERPNQILLRTNGTFKSEALSSFVNKDLQSQLYSNFSSLREIYEAKLKGQNSDLVESDFEGRILTLEDRHSKRQRKSPNIAKRNIPPDVIPPASKDMTPIYEHPKPPRKVIIDADLLMKPPLPPKYTENLNSSNSITVKKIPPAVPRKDFLTKPPPPPAPITPASTMTLHSSTSSDYETCALQNDQMKECKNSDLSILKNFIHCDDVLFKNGINQNQLILRASAITSYPNLDKINFPNKKTSIYHKQPKMEFHTNVFKKKPDDSGYLSTDSNESHALTKKNCPGSETDESFGDGQSESGAESVETHSVFFGSYNKGGYMAGSIDSGVGSDLKPTEAVNVLDSVTVVSNNSDDDNMSYTTVVPLGSGRSRSSSRSSLTHK